MMTRVTRFTKKGLLFYGLLFVLFMLMSTVVKAARQVESKRECATCHIMWLDDFKRKDVTTLVPYEPLPVTKTGKQDVSSTERMCFSCHDGFVLDSRFMWQDKTHSHPVGVTPSKDINIPTSKGKTIFPLNHDGKIYCGSCHTAHGVDWKTEDSPIFMRVKNIGSSLCIACHLEKSTGPKEGNHPIFKKLMQIPDELLDAGSKFTQDGDVTCESCHTPHGGKQQGLLVKPIKKSELCQSCHIDKRELIGSKHDMTVMAPDEKNIHGDDVGEKGACSACHSPHGGKGSALWARKISPTGDQAAAKCTTCHSKQGIAKNKLPGTHSHPINLPMDGLGIQVDRQGWKNQHSWAQDNDKPQELPLYNKQGHQTVKQGRVSCLTCHDPHNWSVKEELKKVEDPKTAIGDGNSKFLRIAQEDGSILCLNCHIDKRTIAQTTHNIESKDANKPKKDSAGICKNCHSAHNAKGVTLRNRGVSQSGSGKASIESWCKDCHQKDGLASDKLVTEHSHPVGMRLKAGVNMTELPLFDNNGARDHQGLVDCSSCHNPHQWTPQVPTKNKLKTKIEQKRGGASNSYLRLAANEDSKLCVVCHQSKALVVGTDHDMNVTAPSATNQSGHAVQESGVCGQCHAIHSPVLGNSLWALPLGEGNDVKEQQCRSCHNEDGIAKNKVPPALQHPSKVLAWSGETRKLLNKEGLPDIPVFSKSGEAGHAGIISCASCHNPHQWNPSKEVLGEGKNVEGDALTSFLRNNNSEHIVCADCHGRDALFRYKYFHSDKSRVKHPLYQ